ncbi:hypothetical protein PFNF135_02144 [Plasmodium falciparum NF135/5.C10]|uniref:Erythrocyte membrane protein 1 n=1 Tax=Plasmodium falciparum NF135/5.C10 TaxID=1036726 RepID=W4IJL1_PLAFA|nr:hypothetical protein PFNF135_02144 [Plasmodium falciparum NF135/5.C10]
MGPPSAVTDYSDAKDFLDQIGQSVHAEVQSDAETYKDELKGSLSHVSTNAETANTADPCTFEYDKHTTLAKGNTKPCGNEGKEDINRFSDKQGAQCDDKKIEGNKGKESGACAPYRRLSLCNKNMVKMDTNNNDGKAKHDLLAEVCMAAKFEGESLNTYSAQYDAEYPSGSGHTTCTALARSFADIGDIVRGRDLYSGNTKEKEKRKQLDDKLKKIFAKIYEKLEQPAKVYYEDKDTDKNYYKLREDWWTANRHTVWKAMTCSEKLSNASYFRTTCSDERGGAQANHYCRCNGDKPGEDNPNTDPPTYFDYVPQYLRWFEEWAEDFCRKKKKYVDIVKTYCRDEKEKYCSLNGYDCTKTKLAIGKYRMGNQCTKCFFACYPYEKWIDNQRKQFLKQKNKYTDEINGTSRSSRQRRGATTSNYEGYEKKFYEKLKGNYSEVNKFLEKLSKENVCKRVEDDKGGTINFKNVNSTSGGTAVGASGTNDASQGTFYRSDYCQPCPYCGMKKKEPGKEWEKKDENCKNIKLYRPRSGQDGTPINFLYSGEGETEIKEKLEQFCTKTQNGGGASGDCGGNSDSSLCEPWKCYHVNQLVKDQVGVEDDDDGEYETDVQNAGGLCILKNDQRNEENKAKSQNNHADIQKTFNNFFNFWVAHMLKDSIHWKKKLEKCLKNGNRIKCGNNKCKDNCGCFLKWVKQKKDEWKPIKEHFYKQEAFKNKGKNGEGDMLAGLMSCPDFVLQYNLKEEFLKGDSEDASAQDNQNSLNAEELKHIREMLQQAGVASDLAAFGGTCTQGPVAEQNTIMDKLLDHEEEIATKCKETHKDDQCKPKAQQENLARAETATSPNVQPASEDDDEDLDNEEDDDEDEDEEDQAVDATVNGDGTEVVEETKKSKPPVDLLRVLNIPKGDYGIPTLKSTNRYIPYGTDRYKGKTYIYMEGDTDEDKYTFMSDTTDITSSSESEYEEIDINDIYVPGSPKYKTLIEVVLEPSKRDTSNKSSGTKDTQNITTSDTPRNKPINDVEWNSLKNDFISNILQNSQMDLPQNNISRDTSINIHPDVSILQDSMQEKPFITSIQDRDLHNGEEVTYNINLDDHKNMNFSTNHDNITPKNNQNDLYTGIDLINDSISGNHNVDIYDELLKRKENELFGTNHTKHTTTNSVAKQTHNEPIVNQINLFHKWLDRHKNMCEQWDKNKKEEFLDKLKKEWNKENNNNSGDINNRYENVLNTDVSIQIDMHNPKPKNEFTNMDTNSDNFIKDTILDDLDKHPETYFYDIYDDDITYFDTDDVKPPMDDIHIKEQTEMNALHNNKMNELLEKEYPISDIWNI